MKAVMYEGRAHEVCGTRLKYRGGNCVYCKTHKPARPERVPDQGPVSDWPTRPIRIERKFRLPMVLLIPVPPHHPANKPWAAA